MKFYPKIHVKECNLDCCRSIEYDINDDIIFYNKEDAIEYIAFSIQKIIHQKQKDGYIIEKLNNLQYRFIENDDFEEIYTFEIYQL